MNNALQKIRTAVDTKKLSSGLFKLAALQDSPKKLCGLAAGAMFLVFLLIVSLRLLLGTGDSTSETVAAQQKNAASAPLATETHDAAVAEVGPADKTVSLETSSQDSSNNEHAVEVLDLTADMGMANSTPSRDGASSTTPADKPDRDADDRAIADTGTTKPVALNSDEDPLPFDILEIEETPAEPTANNAGSDGLEILDLEGNPPAVEPSSSALATTSQGASGANQPQDAAALEAEQKKLRRLRRIEATIAKHPEDREKAIKYGLLLTSMREYKRGERFYLWYLKSQPQDSKAFFGLGQLYEQTRRWADACKAYRRTAELDPKDELARNNMARILAACPNASVRDGKLAVRTAREANALLTWPSPEIADTLAAAFAETGDFRAAIRVQKWAIRSAPQSDRPEMVQRLELYRNKQPYRMP